MSTVTEAQFLKDNLLKMTRKGDSKESSEVQTVFLSWMCSVGKMQLTLHLGDLYSIYPAMYTAIKS